MKLGEVSQLSQTQVLQEMIQGGGGTVVFTLHLLTWIRYTQPIRGICSCQVTQVGRVENCGS